MKPQVLHVLWSGNIGGATRAVFQLVRSQVHLSRYSPVLAFAQNSGFYAQEAQQLGCEVINLELTSDKYIHQARRLKRIFERYPVHHFHSAEITSMLASVLSSRAVRVYTHRGGIIDYKGKRKLRYVLAGYFLRRSFHGLSGNTRHASLCGKELFNTNGQIWHTTYNGIDFSLLSPKRSRSEVARELGLQLRDEIVIGTSAQLRDWKRVDLLLHACAQLQAQSFYLLIIGDGPAKAGLEKLARKLGISSRTVFTGLKERVGDYLGLIDIFVLPSLGLESFGNAVVEAMAQTIPAIVFEDGGGLLEHVQDGVNGYVVTSVEDLKGRLQTLIENSLQRTEMGKQAQLYVTQRYTTAAMIAAYDQLYDSVFLTNRCI